MYCCTRSLPWNLMTVWSTARASSSHLGGAFTLKSNGLRFSVYRKTCLTKWIMKVSFLIDVYSSSVYLLTVYAYTLVRGSSRNSGINT